MKRALTMALALVMVLALSVPALADSTVIGTLDLDVQSVVLNKATNTMGVREEGEEVYSLIDAEGNVLSSEPYIDMREKEDMFEVCTEYGMNTSGLIDGQGELVMPLQYGDIDYLSPRWQIGVILEEATAENYDYQSFIGDDYYLVSAYDVYYNGTKIGSLGRMDYDYAYAFGDYLYVETRDGKTRFYDSAFNQSPYQSEYYSSEYDEQYNGGLTTVWHPGSDQQAFTPGCTLTPDQVEQSLYEIDGKILDLQGNEVLDVSMYDYVYDPEGDYIMVQNDGKYGLIDTQGNEVIPCEYDNISNNSGYFVSGYQSVVKDDKVGFVDTQGQVTCPFTYSTANASAYNCPFTSLTDLDGTTIVLSAQVGELPEHYADVAFNFNNTSPVFAAENAQGQAGIVNLAGNAVIPFDGVYVNTYDFDISNDGSVIVGDKGYCDYTIYRLENGQAATAGEPAADTAGASDADAADAAQEPAAAQACSNCGYVPEGEIPNFCPECGTPFNK